MNDINSLKAFVHKKLFDFYKKICYNIYVIKIKKDFFCKIFFVTETNLVVFIDFQVRILVPLPDIGEWRNWQTQRVQKQSLVYAGMVERFTQRT